jgi:hypothetical protein
MPHFSKELSSLEALERNSIFTSDFTVSVRDSAHTSSVALSH